MGTFGLLVLDAFALADNFVSSQDFWRFSFFFQLFGASSTKAVTLMAFEFF